ncbi:MAG: PTS lactose/cellobiose transporter subunit IIA [Firmicutes bacterium]|nr:PTS lactose/cellobiose transporter subunit IIA [Bacillota bacterium]
MERIPDLEEVSLELILHGGNARAEAFEALKAAREGDFEKAQMHLKQSEEEIKVAHEAQTAMLQSDGEGAKTKADLLFVHAHGHLQTAMAEKGLIEEMVLLYKKLHKDYLRAR